MRGERPVLQALNSVLKGQLTAINQFFLHARMCRNWGLGELNEASYRHSITAMKLADDLIERILFLEGLPNLQDLGKLRIGEGPVETLARDLELLTPIWNDYRGGIQTCEAHGDFVSRDLLRRHLDVVEEQIDWLETQQWLIAELGTENYLQSQL